MHTRTFAALAVIALLAPSLAFAQTAAVTTSANVGVTAAGTSANAGASAKLSATVVATAKSRADKELDRRVQAMTDLNTRVQQMTRVSADFKTQLTATIQNQITALTTLKATIDADTDDATLKADIKSITTSYRIYALILPIARITTAADREVTIASMEDAIGTKIQARVAAAPAGSDTSAVTAALADLGTMTTGAVAQAQASVTGTASLQPDNGDTTIKATNDAALKAARADIGTAQKDLAQARKDISTAIAALGKLGVTGSATVHASTTVSQ